MLLIRNGHVLDPKTGLDGVYDILTDKDIILRIGRELEAPKEDCRVIDAGGLLVAPGLDKGIFFGYGLRFTGDRTSVV